MKHKLNKQEKKIKNIYKLRTLKIYPIAIRKAGNLESKTWKQFLDSWIEQDSMSPLLQVDKPFVYFLS